MNKIFAFLAISLLSFWSRAQVENPYPQTYFQKPLDIPLILSGTFGELRSSHFHSGMDIKTQQQEGLKVYAAADGYVSRISIQEGGYGKALYISDPNGYTTVYGHLQKFGSEIEDYIKSEQYKSESYEIERFPAKNQLRVVGGQVVAYSGNTGGSGGPHLHFEIRDNSQRPMNPMLFGLVVEDSQYPEVDGLYAYPLTDSSHVNQARERIKLKLTKNENGSYTAESVMADGEIGFSIDTYDRLDQAANKNGVVCIETKINGQQNFLVEFNKFSFDESKHIVRFIDFDYLENNKKQLQLLYKKPNNPLSLYKNVVQNGVVKIAPTQNVMYEILVTDFAGNTSTVMVPISYSAPISTPLPVTTSSAVVVPFHEDITFSEGNSSVYFPKNCFYEDVPVSVSNDNDTLRIKGPTSAAQKSFLISFDVSKYTLQDRKYLLIASVWGKNRKMYPLKTSRKGDQLSASTKSFANYTIAEDRTPPVVSPDNFKSGQWMSKYRYLKLKISDDFSGISSYRATINGKWILMEYEYKTGTLTYDFNDGVSDKEENNLKVVVTDNIGNSTTFESVFYRQ
ncbi:MAG: M23 family metallopeptidase [Flavobacteriaceae bacterium]